MKLLFCNACHDIVCVRYETWRVCSCGKSGGQYNHDAVTATIGGNPSVFGIANPFLSRQLDLMTELEKRDFRNKYYPEGKGQDIWWGHYVGDVQLFSIKDPKGPRLKTEGKLNKESNTVTIFIRDRRKYVINGERLKSIIIPNYQGVILGKSY